MDDMSDLIPKVNTGLITVLGTVAAWVWNRASKRVDDHDARILVLERSMPSREESKDMHRENKELMESIRAEFRTFSEESRKDRHDLRERMHGVALTIEREVATRKRDKEEGR